MLRPLAAVTVPALAATAILPKFGVVTVPPMLPVPMHCMMPPVTPDAPPALELSLQLPLTRASIEPPFTVAPGAIVTEPKALLAVFADQAVVPPNVVAPPE